MGKHIKKYILCLLIYELGVIIKELRRKQEYIRMIRSQNKILDRNCTLLGVFIMGWRIIEVTQEDKLQLYLNNLLIKRIEGKLIIPISDIDTLLINNYKVLMTVQLINALMKNNVNLIITNSKHEPSAYVVPINGHHMSLKILEKQLQWTQVYKGISWQNIIKNKIHNQNKHLDIIGMPSYLCQYIDKVKKMDITNREGHAAKVYWHFLFGIDFIRDQSSNKFPIINSMLNYGYAILRGLFVRSIIKKGLDPRISLFHKSFTNFFALASDLMEPFRPIIDHVVLLRKDSAIFSIEIKEALINAMNIKVKINDKYFFLNNAIDMYIDNFVNGKAPLWVDIWE